MIWQLAMIGRITPKDAARLIELRQRLAWRRPLILRALAVLLRCCDA